MRLEKLQQGDLQLMSVGEEIANWSGASSMTKTSLARAMLALAFFANQCYLQFSDIALSSFH